MFDNVSWQMLQLKMISIADKDDVPLWIVDMLKVAAKGEILATVAQIEVLVQRSGSSLDDALKPRSNEMVSKLLSMPHSWLVISVCTKTHGE